MREWQCVTVAFAPSSSCAIGLPTRIERPSTTARAPDSSTPASSSSRITPAGVHGTIASSRPCISRPAFAVVSPSTSLAGSISEMNSSWSRWSGSGSWSRMPSTRSSAFRERISSASSSGATSPPGSWWKDSMPTSAESSRFMRT